MPKLLSQRPMARLAIVLAAFALTALANPLGGVGPYGAVLPFVGIFSWIGLALPRWSSLAVSPLLLAALQAPLWMRGSPPGELTPVAVGLATCVLVGESTAWVAARLRAAEREAARRLRRMERLAGSSLELARCDDPTALADLAARLAVEILDAERAVVLWTDPERRLRGAGGYRWPNDPRSLHLPPSEHPLLAAALRARDVAEPGTGDAPDGAPGPGAGSLAAIPLIGSGSPAGVVLVAWRSRRRPLDAFERSLSRTFSSQVGLALERLRATRALVDASLHDALTGLGNRRRATEALRGLCAGDALILVGLDAFERVNDPLADAADHRGLREAAEHLARSVREHDLVVRWGGAQFLIVARGAGAQATAAAERLVSSWRAGEPVPATSAGVAVHTGGEPASRTLARAAEALYAANREGRGRACAWRPGLAPAESERPGAHTAASAGAAA